MGNFLSVVLVNTKPHEFNLTVDCVKSLQRSTFKKFDVIIVDNGFKPNSSEKLREACPDAVVLAEEKNLGFGGANNVGTEYALSHGADFVLLLNNDTIVKEDTLEILVKTAEGNPDAGVIGAKIYYYDKPNMIWYAGGKLNVDKALGTHPGMGEEADESKSECVDTDFVTGCCLLTRREVIAKIGMLDHNYFIYLEDSDYSLRARRAGYRVLYQPKAVLYHRVSSSTGLDSPGYIYFNLRNKIFFLRKNSTLFRWVMNLPYFTYFYGRQLIRLMFKHRNYRAARAALFGIIDGLRNYTGTVGEGRLYKL
jgi:GT2 family glycosyltransferase